MCKVFDDTLQVREVISRLLSLRQGKGSVTSYSIYFFILVTETEWAENTLQGLFWRGFNDEIKDQLAARDENKTLEEFI